MTPGLLGRREIRGTKEILGQEPKEIRGFKAILVLVVAVIQLKKKVRRLPSVLP